MKIYIAGPITGCDGYEKKFAEAERVLKEQGYIIINPAMLPEGLGDCDTYMGICFAMLLQQLCDSCAHRNLTVFSRLVTLYDDAVFYHEGRPVDHLQ